MKISINTNLIEGAWGGSNQFARSLFDNLIAKGHSVCTDLKAPDIGLILMVHPDKYSKVRRYGIREIVNYVNLHPNTVLVHRVNTSDERRGTNNENKSILESNKLADYTVFISNYLKDLYVQKGFNVNRPHGVIINGADEKVFNPIGQLKWKSGEKMRIVTHHWSNNYMKGFDIYERLDVLLGTTPFRDLFTFTIIGNVPTGLSFRHTEAIKPLSGTELAQVLKHQHLYLTASRNEPAGMHHIEGMRCGLPVLYLNSGALPEYCSPYGVEFNLINFEQKLMVMKERYAELRQKMLSCPYTAVMMAARYIELFEELVVDRKENPVPNPNLLERLKLHLIAKPNMKIKQCYDLIQKARRYVGRN